MKTATDVVAALENTPGRLDKEAIVLNAWNLGITEFFLGCQMAYDALKTYGVKKLPLIEDEDTSTLPSKFTWDSFVTLAGKLERRELTGNNARDALRDAANIANVREWNGFYRRVLLKDMKAGFTDGTINRVLEGDGKKNNGVGPKGVPYLVPVFSCQLAKNGEDHPKKMVGPKLIDPKLDGVRIITILDKEKGTVAQYSRDGRLNDNFPQITSSMESLLSNITKSMVFDGEMVSKNFQALMKQLHKKEADTGDAKLALFDCLPLKDFLAGECKLTQTQRHEALVQFIPLLEKVCKDIYIIPKLALDLSTPEGQITFKEFNREAIEDGYEGIMVKDPNSTYKTKRSDAWLKVKPWITVDLEVVGYEPGKPGSKFEHTLGAILGRTVENGKIIESKVGSGFSDDLRDDIWANRDKVLGWIMEAETDALTKSQDSNIWSLRFPVFARFRGWEPGQKI